MVLIPAVPSKAALIVAPSVLFAIALTAFVARIYARFRSKLIALDDVLLAIGVLFAAGLFCNFEIIVAAGLGQHYTKLSPHQLFVITVGSFALPQLYMFSTSFVKISLAWQLIRLRGSHRLWRIALWTLIAATLAILIASEIIIYISCRPLAAIWDFSIRDAVCISPSFSRAWNFLSTAWPLFSDVVLSLSPIIFIRKLKVKLREKILIGGLMALGLLCSAATIPRFLVLDIPKTLSADHTFAYAPFDLWSVLEVFIGISAVSIPPLRHTFGTYIGRLLSSLTRVSETESSSRKRIYVQQPEPKELRGISQQANAQLNDKPSPALSWDIVDDSIDLEIGNGKPSAKEMKELPDEDIGLAA